MRLLLFLLFAAYCTMSAAKVHKVHFSNAEGAKLHNATASVARGDTLEISFFGLLSTGFEWWNVSTPKHLHLAGSLKQEVLEPLRRCVLTSHEIVPSITTTTDQRRNHCFHDSCSSLRRFAGTT